MRSIAILSGILFVLPGALAAQHQAPPEIVRDDRLAMLEQRVRAPRTSSVCLRRR